MTSLLCFLSTIILSDEIKIPKCQDIKIEVQSTFVDYQYDNKTMKLLSKKLEVGPLEPQWSNETREMKEVFFKYNSESDKADSVKIVYVREKDNKVLVDKTYALEKSKNKILKIKGFLFENGVQEPNNRPGIQSYIFQKDKKPICQSVVMHYHATEVQ